MEASMSLLQNPNLMFNSSKNQLFLRGRTYSLLPNPNLMFNSSKHQLFLRRRTDSLLFNQYQFQYKKRKNNNRNMVIEAKGKRGMQSRKFQSPRPPPLPKFEDDGNPRFVVFIRMANVSIWYPLSVISGGSTAKIILAAKDNFPGKYIYKDTLARNLGAVIYKDEAEIKKNAIKQHRILQNCTEFRYGYKIVENNNMRAALATNDVVQLPTQAELKTVVDKVKDFFGNAKESFGKLTNLDNATAKPEENATEK